MLTTRRLAARAAGDLAQLFTGGGMGLAGLLLLCAALACLPAGVVAGLGLFLFVGVVLLVRRLADRQRRRAGALLGTSVPRPYRPLDDPGATGRLRTVIRDPATWRDLAWLPCQFVAGTASTAVGVGLWLAVPECLTAPLLRALLPSDSSYGPAVLELVGRSGWTTWLLVPIAVPLAVLAYRLPPILLVGQARLAHRLLAPTASARLSNRVDQLTATRAAVVDASAGELRRLERDLHDGAQMRLAALAMALGVAEDVIDADPATAKTLVAEARANAGAALRDLRALVRGIHPPVLADRGLAGAAQALALASPLPVALDLRLNRRLSAPVESAAYFALAEALANAVRHSDARGLAVAVVDAGPALHLAVRDDGRGGADPAAGTGLRGIQRRLSAFDGTLTVTSPPGGPTVLSMELPCVS
jgi:signal transduction histidine kinase